MYNILEHKQAITKNIQKAFGDTLEDIEKAKWQIGEIRVDSRGIAHECYEYTAEGKPRLRRVKKNKGASTTSTDDGGSKKQKSEKTLLDFLRKPDNNSTEDYKKAYKIADYAAGKGETSVNDLIRFVSHLNLSDKKAENRIVNTANDIIHYAEKKLKKYNDSKKQTEQPQKDEVDNFMKLVQKFSDKYTDESKVTVTKTPKGNWDVSYNSSRLGIINADQLSEKTAKAKGWLEEDKKNDKNEENEKIDIQDYFGKRPTKGGKFGNELKLIYDTAIKAFNNSLTNKDFSESNAEKFLKDTFKSFYFDDKSIENYVFYSLDKWKKAVKKYNDKNFAELLNKNIKK